MFFYLESDFYIQRCQKLGNVDDWQNAYLSYGKLISKATNADSGFGRSFHNKLIVIYLAKELGFNDCRDKIEKILYILE